MNNNDKTPGNNLPDKVSVLNRINQIKNFYEKKTLLSKSNTTTSSEKSTVDSKINASDTMGLPDKMQISTHKEFHNLEICENSTINIENNYNYHSSNNFAKGLTDPYSDDTSTIKSLRKENDELVKKVYKLTQDIDGKNIIEQKFQSLLDEKESTLQSIHNAYQDKINQAFSENILLSQEIETLKNLLAEKENVIAVLHREQSNIEEKVSALTLINSGLKKAHDEDLEKITSLNLVNTGLKQAHDENSEKILALTLVNAGLKKAHDEMLAKSGHKGILNQNEKQIIQSGKHAEAIQELNNIIAEKDSELKLLVKDNFAWEEKYQQLEKEMEEMRNKITKEKSDELIVEYSKLFCIEVQNQELLEKLQANESRCKQLEEANEELRDLIAKDQHTIQFLMEFKEKHENLTANSLSEENNILAEYDKFKTENRTIREQLIKDHLTIEEQVGLISNLKAEKEEFIIQIERRDRALIALKESNDDLKQKIKNQEAEFSARCREKISFSGDNNSFTMPGVGAVCISQAKVVTSFDQYAMTREMMIDYLYCLYLYESSINLHQMLESLLGNFNIFIGSIFIRKDEYNFAFSITNEFLEDIFLRIYDKYMMKTLTAPRSSNLILTSNDIWTISQEDITREMINEIALEIQSQNVISSIVGSSKESKSVDMIIELFVKKYESIFDFGSNSLVEYINAEIRPSLTKKVEKYKRAMSEDIESLIEQSLRYIQAGKVSLNGKELYNFKNFFLEYFSRDLTKKDTLYISNPIATSEALDNITTAIKYSSYKHQKIHLNGNFDGTSELAFSKIYLTIVMHSSRLVGLTITSCNLSGYLMKYVIKMTDYLKFLKILDLSNDSIGDDGVKYLCESIKLNKSIVELNLSKNLITTNGGFYLADALIKNKTLEKLNLGYNHINENGMSSLLTVLTNNNEIIKDLDIAGNHLLEDDYQYISDFLHKNSAITSLNISDNAILPQSASFLGSGIRKSQQLRTLNISNSSLNEESAPLLLKHLNECKIKELYLDCNPLGEVGSIVFASGLKNNTELKVASLKKCKITSMALTCIAKSICQNTALEELNIEENSFDEQWLLMFAGLVKDKKVKVKMTVLGMTLKVRDIFKGMKNIILI